METSGTFPLHSGQTCLKGEKMDHADGDTGGGGEDFENVCVWFPSKK